MSLNWGARPPHRMGSALIGKIILSPQLEYTVEIWGDMASSSTPHREHYHIKLEAFGCSAGKILYTQEEAQAYLDRQSKKVAEFATVKSKKEAVANRMKPLQKKWSDLSEQTFRLLEVK